MNVVGLDLSLTATGVAYDGLLGTSTIKSKQRGMDRLIEIRNRLLDLTEDAADLVVIEDYAFSRGDAHSHALGELGGVVRLALYEADVPYVDVKATTLKRYATGRGNANKGQMIEAASKRSGLSFDGDDNRVDSWFLRAMALDHYGEPLVAMPALNRTSLAAVPWPELVVAS